jgi:hypothetical protein
MYKLSEINGFIKNVHVTFYCFIDADLIHAGAFAIWYAS